MLWLHFSLLLAALQGAISVSIAGNRLLVAIEDVAEKARYSILWSDLEERGYELTFSSSKSDGLFLFRHGERLFDHLILLPTKSKGLSPALMPKSMLQWLDKGGNTLVLLAGDLQTPLPLSSLLAELEIHLPPERVSSLLDHFNYDAVSAPERHDVLLVPYDKSDQRKLLQLSEEDGTLAFPRCVGQDLGAGSPLITPLIRAPESSYTYSEKEDTDYSQDPFATGTQVSLASALQARNSARLAVVGSAEVFQDKWFDAKIRRVDGSAISTSNRRFARHITSWIFQETGVLRVGRVEHYATPTSDSASTVNGSVDGLHDVNPPIYRISSDVTFDIEISQYHMDSLKSFEVSDLDELQLEFSMLSPFHRVNLAPISRTASSTIYQAKFRLPDQHGIFRFQVNYKRPLMTYLDVKREVTVRHFAHDEWPRSWRIMGGWVWIAGIWTTIIGWLFFIGLWLYSSPKYVGDPVKKLQ